MDSDTVYNFKYYYFTNFDECYLTPEQKEYLDTTLDKLNFICKSFNCKCFKTLWTREKIFNIIINNYNIENCEHINTVCTGLQATTGEEFSVNDTIINLLVNFMHNMIELKKFDEYRTIGIIPEDKDITTLDYNKLPIHIQILIKSYADDMCRYCVPRRDLYYTNDYISQVIKITPWHPQDILSERSNCGYILNTIKPWRSNIFDDIKPTQTLYSFGICAYCKDKRESCFEDVKQAIKDYNAQVELNCKSMPATIIFMNSQRCEMCTKHNIKCKWY